MIVERSAFELTNQEGLPLRGDVWSGEGLRPGTAIVVCHGFKGFKDWGFFPYTAEQITRRTARPVVTFNFAGSGIGPDLQDFTELDLFEDNTFSKELDDLQVILDAIESGDLPELEPCGSFGLLGHSRGGVASIITAAEDTRVAALVTWNAVSRLDRWTDEQKQEWRREGRLEVLNTRTGQLLPLGVGLLEDVERNRDRLDPLKAASRLNVPYLIVHGAEDESVSVSEGEELADAAADGQVTFHRIEGAGHTFGAVHPFEGPTEDLGRAIQLTADWFIEHLSAST